MAIALNVSQRPVIRPSRSKPETALEVLSAAGLAAAIVLAVRAYPSLPETVPIHFNLKGDPDGWADKGMTYLMPGVSVGLYVLLTVVSRFPHRFNYLRPVTMENAERVYRSARTMIVALKCEVMWLFATLIWDATRVAMGATTALNPWLIWGAVGIVLATVFGGVISGLREAEP